MVPFIISYYFRLKFLLEICVPTTQNSRLTTFKRKHGVLPTPLIIKYLTPSWVTSKNLARRDRPPARSTTPIFYFSGHQVKKKSCVRHWCSFGEEKNYYTFLFYYFFILILAHSFCTQICFLWVVHNWKKKKKKKKEKKWTTLS